MGRGERKEGERKKGQPSPQGESEAPRVEVALGGPEKKMEERKRRDRSQDPVVSRDLDGTSCPPLGQISRAEKKRLRGKDRVRKESRGRRKERRGRKEKTERRG